MKNKFDVCILGAGPAGLTAAIYSARYGLKVIVISKEIGGAANRAEHIENYPGYIGSGKELMKKFHEQARKYGTKFLDEDIIDIKKQGKEFIITTSKEKIIARTLIISLGTQRRKLNIPGEDKFLGKGVSYCATCDANFFKNKDVAVIGGGNTACRACLLLAGIARKVYLVYRREKLRCEYAEIKKVEKMKNIKIMYGATPFEIKGKNAVSELIIVKPGKIPVQEKIDVSGVFIEIGGLPASDIAKILGVKIDKEGHILVDEEMRTSVPGIFAAGDVIKSKLKQVVVAASQGAIAAKSAQDYLSGR